MTIFLVKVKPRHFVTREFVTCNLISTGKQPYLINQCIILVQFVVNSIKLTIFLFSELELNQY